MGSSNPFPFFFFLFFFFFHNANETRKEEQYDRALHRTTEAGRTGRTREIRSVLRFTAADGRLANIRTSVFNLDRSTRDYSDKI